MTDSQTQVPHKKPSAAKSRRGRRIFGLIIIVLVLMLAVASFFLIKLVLPQGNIASSASDTGGLEWVRSIYGWGKAKNEQMIAPVSVAIGPDGTIWVVNPGNRRIVGFNPSGTFKTMFDGSSKTKFISPTDVGVDPAGNLYVAENTVNRVIVMTPAGQELRVLRVQTPTAVTASADRIVVGSVGGFVIYDKEGNPIKVVGSKGQADSQFDGVNGLAITSDGRIIVADSYNNRLSEYDNRGNRLWIVKTGNPANQTKVQNSSSAPKASGTEANMQLPLQATMDGNGRFVVIDGFDMSLNVFDPKDGHALKKYGAFGSEDGKMLYPSGLAYDRTRDWFAVADNGNDRVQIFRIPDSAPGSAVGSVSRVLAGPIRACVFPLVLLLIVIIIAVVTSRRRKKRELKPQPVQTVQEVDAP